MGLQSPTQRGAPGPCSHWGSALSTSVCSTPPQLLQPGRRERWVEVSSGFLQPELGEGPGREPGGAWDPASSAWSGRSPCLALPPSTTAHPPSACPGPRQLCTSLVSVTGPGQALGSAVSHACSAPRMGSKLLWGEAPSPLCPWNFLVTPRHLASRPHRRLLHTGCRPPWRLLRADVSL